MKERVFYEKGIGGFTNYTTVFFYKIDYDYVELTEKDREYVNYIKQTLFYTPLNENVGGYLLLVFSRAIAGDRMKKIFFGLGSANAGKSLAAKAFTNAFCGYVGIFNAECLSSKHSSNDEAQQNRWAFLLRHVRLLFSNEIKTEMELNGAAIKKHSSGGDGLVGRVHGGLETTFVPHYKLVIYANDIPEIKPYDDALETRVEVFSYRKTFVDNPTNEFELKKNNELENEINTLKFKRGLINLVIERYGEFMKNEKVSIPKEMEGNKVEWIGDTTRNMVENFLTEFDITDNKDDYVLSSEMVDWLCLSKLGVSFKKFSIELKKYISIKKYANVKPNTKKIKMTTVNVWLGVKSKNIN